MKRTVDIAAEFLPFVEHEVASGRFADVDMLVRAAQEPLVEREQDARLRRSIAEADAGLGVPADQVFDELERELKAAVIAKAP